jgi:hypothetical protein
MANRPDSSILKIVSQTDVKGFIPKYIVNYVASKAPIDWVNNLKKACIKAQRPDKAATTKY